MSPSSTRPLARIAVLLVIGSASAALAGACGDSTTPVTAPADGGEEGGFVQRADCPTTEPENGSTCLFPEGTTCDFGACGTRLARCTQGSWRVGGNAAPSPPCPGTPPTENSKCPACWPKTASCTYGSTDCSAADASLLTAITTCPSGTWVFDIRPCRDGGGADVQRDGEPDAD